MCRTEPVHSCVWTGDQGDQGAAHGAGKKMRRDTKKRLHGGKDDMVRVSEPWPADWNWQRGCMFFWRQPFTGLADPRCGTQKMLGQINLSGSRKGWGGREQ